MNPQSSNRQTQITAIVASSIVVTAGLVLLVFLLQTIATTTIPFDNDEANHAVDGLWVYRALVPLNWGKLYQVIVRQSFYPPVHSIFVAMSYWLSEPSLAASRMPSVFIGAGAVLGMTRLTFEIARKRTQTPKIDRWLPVAGATFSFTLAIFSLTFILNAVLCMLEMTGAMLAVVLMAIAHRIDRTKHGRSRGVALCAVVVMLLFLTKYSFGLFFSVGLVGALFGPEFPQIAIRQPAAILTNATCNLSIQNLTTRGNTGTGNGERGISLLACHMALTKVARRVTRQIRREIAIALGVYALIFGVWLLVTHRPTMFMFFSTQKSYVPFWSMENWIFYPQAWLTGYSSNAFIGLLALILASLGTVRYWSLLSARVAAWSALAALSILTISTTNEFRHILVVVPGIWMLAGLGLVEVLRFLGRKGGDRIVAGAIAFLWAVLLVSAIEPAARLPDALVENFEGLPVYTQMQDFALQNVDLDRPGLLLGFSSDRYRLLAMRWRAAVLSGMGLEELNFDYFPFDKREFSLKRFHRQPQIASIDPTFPRDSLQAVLDRRYYAWAIVTRPPDEPIETDLSALQGYPHLDRKFEGWEIVVYQLL